MKFSIVIPIYKVEKYLRECVDSVLSQSFSDFEAILVDDGSPDNCPQICDEYANSDTRVKVIHQENAGLSCARNAGIKEAVGEYVVCIDSDDYLKDNSILQKIADKAVDDVDVVLHGFQKFYESTNSLGNSEIPILKGKCSTLEMLQEVMSNNSYCGTAWTKAVRLSILHDNHIEFRSGMISEDIDWYLHLLCYAKTFDSINEAAIIYRQRPGSISHAPKLNSLTDNLWILEYWPNQFKSLVPDKALMDSILSVMAYYYANNLILFTSYSYQVAKPYKQRLKALSYMLDYAKTPRALAVGKFYKLFGFNITILFLKLLSKIKKHQ